MDNYTSEKSVVGFYGYSNSGKTSIICKLIEELDKEGLRVGVIKCTNKEISSEPAGKDTQNFRAAGAKITSFSSESETNFVIPGKLSANSIASIISAMTEIDLVLVEGANEPDIPKIRFGEILERENTIFTYDGDFQRIHSFILDMKNRKDNNGENKH